jgi:hypothetical protein
MDKARLARPLAVALLLLGVAGAAQAKDVCVQGPGGEQYVFLKVKKLKPGRAVPLQGFYILNGVSGPLTGTAISKSSGQIEALVMASAMSFNSFTGNLAVFDMVVGDDFSGFGAVDSDGDFQPNLSNYTWSAIDCKTVVLP